MKLYAHQEEALRLMEGKDAFALLLDMGLGKTCVTIQDWIRRPGTNLLVVAPKGVFRNWAGEIEKFKGDQQIKIAHWVSGGNQTQKRLISDIIKPDPTKRRAYLVNVESLSTVKDAIKSCYDFIVSGPTMMVVDESTSVKSPKSKRTQTILGLGVKAKYRRILSGLITPNSPLDLFSQLQFLDWRILGFQNFYSFRARHAIMKKMSFGWRNIDVVVGYRYLDELQEKLSHFSYRKLKEECLDLPPKIYTERSVELSLEQQRVYKELVKNATSQLDSGEYVTSTTAVGLLTKLHQVICGHVKDDQGNVRGLDATPREDGLLQILEESQGKIIIWANYRHSIQRLIKLIGDVYGKESLVHYWGDTGDEDRELAKLRFQEDPSCRFFIGNQEVGGLGITLTKARYTIYYCNNFNLEDRLQSEDRPHRIGLEHSEVYIDLVTRGTVEEKILKALRGKMNIAAQITGEMVREWIR